MKLKCIILLSILSLAWSCSRYDRGQTIVITGSSTIAPLIMDLARIYEKSRPGVRVDVQTGGSSRGLADVRKGLAQIGMVSRALKADEADLRRYTLALDGLCIILHKSNPVGALNVEQIRGIYRGEIKNWKDLGGRNTPITVVHKAENRA